MRWLAAFALLGPTTWSFEKDEVDKEPAGFEFATTNKTPAGTWRVVKDGDGKVLAQLDADETDGRFAIAVVKDSSFKDLSLSVKAKPVSGKVDQAAGLVWRWRDADNYYVVRLNALEGNVRLYRVVKGSRRQFAGKESVELKAGTWYTLAVRHKGASIAVLLDGKELFAAEDATFDAAGKIGVWTKSDSVTRFDDLTAEELK